jgi:hypothetical protein
VCGQEDWAENKPAANLESLTYRPLFAHMMLPCPKQSLFHLLNWTGKNMNMSSLSVRKPSIMNVQTDRLKPRDDLGLRCLAGVHAAAESVTSTKSGLTWRRN